VKNLKIQAKHKRSRIIFYGLSLFALGYALTWSFLIIIFRSYLEPIYEYLFLPAVFPFRAILYGSRAVLPESLLLQYDPMPPPFILHTAIILNAVYLGALSYAIILFLKKLRKSKPEGE
jgi:hypothetical protein